MRRGILLVSTAALLAGCATVGTQQQNKDERFKAAVSALGSGNFGVARSELAWLAEHFPAEKTGQRALLILAALEMDPRNPDRHPDAGADLAGRFLRVTDRDGWADPLAQTLYLLGVELGAAEDRVAQDSANKARVLPKLPGPTVSARIKTVEQDRDRLAKRVAALEEQLALKDRELERIRKTIKP